MSKCSDANVVFQTAVFLIPVVRNNKRSPGINSKPVIAFPEFVYITIIFRCVSVSAGVARGPNVACHSIFSVLQMPSG